MSRFSRRASGWKPADTTVKAKRRLWRIQRGGFEEVSRFSRRASGWKPADTTVCAFAHFSSWWEKWAAGGTFPTRENHPLERKRKPAKRERIPTTSLRTGLGMTGLAYERIFSSPIKSTLPCTVSLRGNRRSAACGGYSEAVSRKCPGFHAVQAAGNRLTRRCVLLPTFPAVDKKYAAGGTFPT